MSNTLTMNDFRRISKELESAQTAQRYFKQQQQQQQQQLPYQNQYQTSPPPFIQPYQGNQMMFGGMAAAAAAAKPNVSILSKSCNGNAHALMVWHRDVR